MRSLLWLPICLFLVVAVVIGIILFIPGDIPDSTQNESELSQAAASKSANESGLEQTRIAKENSTKSDANLAQADKEKTTKEQSSGSESGLIASVSSDLVRAGTDSISAEADGSKTSRPGVIKGHIFEQRNKPLPGVTVSIDGSKSTVSAQDGLFQFENIQGKTVTLDAKIDGYYPLRKENIPVGGQDINLIMVPSGMLAGRVVDQFNNAIASAQVTLKSGQGVWMKNMNTDRDGRFEVSNPPAGSITIQAALTGYTDKGEGTKTITFPVSEPVIIKLEQPTFSIIGRVVLKDANSPVSGFHLAAKQQDSAEKADIKNSVTDGTGMFTFEGVQAGTYMVSSLPKENVSLNLTIPVDQDFKNVRVADKDVKDVIFYAVQGLTVSGVVTTDAGQPVNGAEVTIARLQSSKTVSDSQGNFTLANVPSFSAGYTAMPQDFALQLLATHTQYGSGQSDPLPANNGQPITGIAIVLHKSSTLSGRIIDEAGNAIAGAQLRLRDVIQNQILETQSDAAGSFTFNQIPSVKQVAGQFRGTHVLEVQKEGYEKKNQELIFEPGENKTITIKLMGGGMIQGYLSDKNGNTVRGAIVTTYLPQGGKVTALSDETGVYRLTSLPNGNYDLSFRLESKPPLTAFLYDVQVGNTNANVTMIYQEWISTGTVFDADTKQPIHQFMIIVEGTPMGREDRKFSFVRSVNSPDGTFQIVFNEPGLYRYRFTSPNYHPEEGSVKIDPSTMHTQFINPGLKPLQSTGGVSGELALGAELSLAGVNVLGFGSYPSSGNSFSVDKLPVGMVDLLFHVRDNSSGSIYPLGILRGVPIQANQIFAIGSISPNQLTVRYREP